MIFLPVALNITDKKILFIGGGNTAYHKIISVLRFTKDISLLALEFNDKIKNLGLPLIQKAYQSSDLEGYNIIYACTNDRSLNIHIKNDAEKLFKLVNVCDDPEICHFVSPAIYKKGNIAVAVSSNATDVKQAIRLRNKIQELFDNDTFEG